jgi:hypothetical protein
MEMHYSIEDLQQLREIKRAEAQQTREEKRKKMLQEVERELQILTCNSHKASHVERLSKAKLLHDKCVKNGIRELQDNVEQFISELETVVECADWKSKLNWLSKELLGSSKEDEVGKAKELATCGTFEELIEKLPSSPVLHHSIRNLIFQYISKAVDGFRPEVYSKPGSKVTAASVGHRLRHLLSDALKREDYFHSSWREKMQNMLARINVTLGTIRDVEEVDKKDGRPSIASPSEKADEAAKPVPESPQQVSDEPRLESQLELVAEQLTELKIEESNEKKKKKKNRKNKMIEEQEKTADELSGWKQVGKKAKVHASQTVPSQQGPQVPEKEKNKPQEKCAYHVKGICVQGSHCPFLHVERKKERVQGHQEGRKREGKRSQVKKAEANTSAIAAAAFSKQTEEEKAEEKYEIPKEQVYDEQEQSLFEWVSSLGLDESYLGLFRTHEVEFKDLSILTEEDLDRIGITKVGPRRKIWMGIQQMKQGERAIETPRERLLPPERLSPSTSAASVSDASLPVSPPSIPDDSLSSSGRSPLKTHIPSLLPAGSYFSCFSENGAPAAPSPCRDHPMPIPLATIVNVQTPKGPQPKDWANLITPDILDPDASTKLRLKPSSQPITPMALKRPLKTFSPHEDPITTLSRSDLRK